jgi:hypothetical protein
MRNLAYLAFTVLLVAAFGCAITNYPVMFDTRGPDDNQIVDSFYDKAYIVPSGQVATIYDDGSDELFTLVAQDWRGDQWLYTYNNFDPSGIVTFLDQTYCDPTRQSDCALATAWNPDLPEAYPFGSSPINGTDDPFDYVFDESCSGARSLSLLVSQGTRFGECGSGVWADKQAAAAEFAALDVTTFQGREFYSLPLDSRNTSLRVNSLMDDASANAPIFGRFQGYVDNELRLAVPMTPNAKYQAKWFANWIANHGAWNEIELTHNGLTANFTVTGILANQDRL